MNTVSFAEKSINIQVDDDGKFLMEIYCGVCFLERCIFCEIILMSYLILKVFKNCWGFC